MKHVIKFRNRGAALFFVEEIERFAPVLCEWSGIRRHTFADLGPGNVPSISAGVVAYPHLEAQRPDDLFTLVETALQRAKTSASDRIAVVGEG